jgi:hypothetical protein
MTNPTKLVHDISSDTYIEIPLSVSEIQQIENMEQESSRQIQSQELAKSSALLKLKSLGFSDNEIVALIGNKVD